MIARESVQFTDQSRPFWPWPRLLHLPDFQVPRRSSPLKVALQGTTPVYAASKLLLPILIRARRRVRTHVGAQTDNFL